ncbi:hypothetical protein QJS10_CPA10g01791 [Acorus calamus]|uniref:DUF4408 domain-containing protein n=1 Tax=Acorus calamus TaxID=4465 RepID=A0AAV9E1K1_ACOCL|nr:hypothetical protein QJS10_CPA10g01791 [Acorus calamus]
MDSMKQHKLQPLSKSKKLKPLKKSLKTLLPILSILFFSLYTPPIPQAIKTFTNRQCMFILSNCILLFISGKSGLFISQKSDRPDLYDEFHKRSGPRRPPMEADRANHTKEIMVHGEEVVESNVESLELVVVKGEGQEELDCLSIEELNKKFEEFIEKFKRQR